MASGICFVREADERLSLFFRQKTGVNRIRDHPFRRCRRPGQMLFLRHNFRAGVSLFRQIRKGTESKKAKDFATADAIREELLSKGVEIKDTREGVKWQLV